jgi:hypothetical protein
MANPIPTTFLYERKVYRAKGLRLKSLIDRGVDRFEYVYDFGGNWIHDILIEDVRDGEAELNTP